MKKLNDAVLKLVTKTALASAKKIGKLSLYVYRLLASNAGKVRKLKNQNG